MGLYVMGHFMDLRDNQSRAYLCLSHRHRYEFSLRIHKRTRNNKWKPLFSFWKRPFGEQEIRGHGGIQVVQ